MTTQDAREQLADTRRIVKCPSCGKDKWAYMGNDLPEEPPCFVCKRAEACRCSATERGFDTNDCEVHN